MMLAALLALLAIALLAAGTPRQAELLFGRGFGRPARKVLRIAGLVLLAFSLGATMAGDDQGRQLVSWVGVIGLEALAVALGFTTLTRRLGAR